MARALDLLRLSGNPQQVVLCDHLRAIRGSLAPAGGGGRWSSPCATGGVGMAASPKENQGFGTGRSLVRQNGVEMRIEAHDGAAVPVAFAA